MIRSSLFSFRWNQLDVLIVLLSMVGIVMEQMKNEQILPINPTLIRVMRVLRITRGKVHSIICEYEINHTLICESSEAVEDGQRYSIIVEYSSSGTATSRKSGKCEVGGLKKE